MVVSAVQVWTVGTYVFLLVYVFASLFYWPAAICQIQLSFSRLFRILIADASEKSPLKTRIVIAWYSIQGILAAKWIFAVVKRSIDCVYIGTPILDAVYSRVNLVRKRKTSV